MKKMIVPDGLTLDEVAVVDMEVAEIPQPNGFGGGKTYSTERVAFAVLEDGRGKYVCTAEGCGYFSDKPQVVLAHTSKHVDRSEPMSTEQLLAKLEDAIARIEDERAFITAHGRALSGVRTQLQHLRNAVADKTGADGDELAELREKAYKFDQLSEVFK